MEPADRPRDRQHDWSKRPRREAEEHETGQPRRRGTEPDLADADAGNLGPDRTAMSNNNTFHKVGPRRSYQLTRKANLPMSNKVSCNIVVSRPPHRVTDR